MKPFKKILTRFNGLSFRQDYLCLAKEKLDQPLYAYLLSQNRVFKDITNLHLFVGYHPLLFAFIHLPGSEPVQQIEVVFSPRKLELNDMTDEALLLARLHLNLARQLEIDGSLICFYQGTKGSHRFVNGRSQFLQALYNQLYNRKAGNVFLDRNLYTQVQIAYSLPRTISLITVGDEGEFNMFPTDLHGTADNEHYIISLRTNGKACQQVLSTKKILVSEVHCDQYKTVYGLGKNHMQPMRAESHFPVSGKRSAKYGLPIPLRSLLNRELELKESFVLGIHTIMVFQIKSIERLVDEGSTLSHIHNAYATWRQKNNLAGNYFMR